MALRRARIKVMRVTTPETRSVRFAFVPLTKNVHVGLGLTRRSSGLATLAAELHFVRRCSVMKTAWAIIPLCEAEALPMRPPNLERLGTGRELVAPRGLPAFSESSRVFGVSRALP